MNILHITTFLQGGAGRIITELACSQAGHGHRVRVVANNSGEQGYVNYPEWINKLESSGVDLVSVESTFKREVSLNVAAFETIIQKIDCTSLSLIHTHAAIPSLIALLLRSFSKSKVPILQTMHGWGIRKSPEQAFTDTVLMNSVDHVVAVSESSRRLLIQLGVKESLVSVVPNGVASASLLQDNVVSERLIAWRKRGMKILVCVGTVGKRKNQRLLIEALALPKTPRNIACEIVGEGEDLSALCRLAQERGIQDRVHFSGYQPNGAQFIANADWLILPSNDEGLPLSILEAYSSGVPVIGSNISEIAEIIVTGKTGILFNAGDVDSLARALAEASDMPEVQRMQMAEESKKLWRDQYRLERMLDMYNQIYYKLLQGSDILS